MIISLKSKPFHLLVICCTLIIAAVYFVEYVLGHTPCVLCLYQRLPWYGLLIIGFLGWRWQNRLGTVPRPLMWLAAICALGSTLLAGYHSGVEFGWWPGPTTCGGITGSMDSEALKAKLLATAPVRCDEVNFRIFGASLAVWNYIISALVFFSSLLWLRTHRHV